MKKSVLAGAALLISGLINAQFNFDFEGFNVPQDSFLNNAPSGYFESGSFRFYNDYDAQFNYNLGFSISRVKDSVTGDYTNSHGAITALGDASSENYAMFYSFGHIEVSPSIKIDSLRITNGTYAYRSMQNGDFFAKQFGSPYNASGQLDGTNGEDFFRVLIEGVDNLGNVIDTVVFYLADFRFANSSQDYILRDWATVNLTSLNVGPNRLVKLNFYLESSDNDPQFGMNTPAYFAIDNISYSTNNLGIDEFFQNAHVFPNPFNDQLNIADADQWEVYSADGKKMASSVVAPSNQLNTSSWPNGIYVVRVDTNGAHSTIKIVK